MTFLSKIFFAIFVISSLTALSACNTVEGLGKDTRAAGEAITGSARDNKGY